MTQTQNESMNEPKLVYRSVFVSDFHLGAVGCRAEDILQFLAVIECDRLYLVGDIIDFWVGKRKGKWRQSHTNVIRAILEKSRDGVQIFVTPGNHDSELRRLNGVDFSGIFVDHQFVHEMVDGSKLLVVHGDYFDRSVTTLKPLAVLGSWLYEILSVFNRIVNAIRAKSGKEPTQFSGSAKKRVKQFVAYFTNFPDRITVDAKNQGYAGVVCGHVHRPKLEMHESGAQYINAGDWVENCTAVVEHLDGRLELVFWEDLRKELQLEAPCRSFDAESAMPRLF